MESYSGERGAARLDELKDRALHIRDLYDDLNLSERGRTWTREEFVLGFVGDVGDLAKLVLAQEGAREMLGGRDALGHELADCLWSILVIASEYNMDLSAEFERTMGSLSADLRSRLGRS